MFLKNNVLKSILFLFSDRLPSSYLILALLRVFLTILPQTGYLHPDEFFQNVEVVAGDIFNIHITKTWEFNIESPIRNILIPNIIFGPPFLLIRFLDPYLKTLFSIDLKSPYLLLVVPRLCMCLLSFVNDYCLYRICIIYGEDYKNRLNIFATSYVTLVYCCRSFSNSLEFVLFSILQLQVAENISPNMVSHNDDPKIDFKKSIKATEERKTQLIAILLVIGVFNRVTFLGFAFVPICIWLLKRTTNNIDSNVISTKLISLLIYGIPTFLIMVIIDSIYYGYVFDKSQYNWVITPLNFFKYNANTNNLFEQGMHARWMHLLVNVPVLFHVLGVMGIGAIANIFYKFLRGQRSIPRIQSITGLMLSSLIVPVALLSLFPHQEARFIIPILLPLVYLYGNQLLPNESDDLKTKTTKRYCFELWIGLNIVSTFFFGFIHQGGVYSLSRNLHYDLKSNSHVHTYILLSHIYSIPEYLLQAQGLIDIGTEGTIRNPFIYQFKSLQVDEMFDVIDDILYSADSILTEFNISYRIYLAIPCSLEQDLWKGLPKHIKLKETNSFYPHFSSESMPTFPERRDKHCSGSLSRFNQSLAADLSLFARCKCYLSRFCLKLYTIHN